MRWLRLGALGVPLVLAAEPSLAGPPFSTDSADVIEYGSTEIDLYAETSRSPGYTSATLPGVQIDHGLLPNTQVRLVAPLAFASGSGSASQLGVGDLQLGIKYGLLAQTEDHPAVSIFPLLLIPVGSVSRGLGQGRPSVALPIWITQHIGAWKVYGGGGVAFERLSGGRGRNAPFFGVAFTRTITGRLSLGAEIFHREATLIGAKASTNVNVEGSYDLSSRYHVYFSVGRGLQNLSSASRASLYGALAVTF